jgi:hypothetical protein
MLGGAVVDGGDRGGDLAQPGQQHTGQADHPPIALLGGQMN